ncbi:hypothetical protein C5Y96_18125 [Blastopirellula marina]|uniref:Uncharacterized protein n=1 Tax=Blastopirellula marina TaxID=124 RepID=A0A2S8F5L5_9BACT|nr:MULTISPECIES: hypothetical protein [Pirellulaceae]PQO27455.1 hypothetical protein C5Y96_18125 [Blastopirellula marina]RCS47992.1 hypothetical protein DTL36_18150 [Bremerella cremea]
MDRIRCLVLVTLFSAILPAIAAAQSPRVMVELAFVTRVRLSTEQPPLSEEFEKQLEDSKLAQEGLVPFLDQWLRDKDRDLHEVDLMQLKIPLGEEVEFTTRHSLAAEFADPKGMFEGANIPMMPGMGLLDETLNATVRTDNTPDEQLLTRFRFEKHMPTTTLENVNDPGAPPVPVLHRQAVSTRIKSESGKTTVLGGMLKIKNIEGKEFKQDLAVLVRVGLADPAPFPAN